MVRPDIKVSPSYMQTIFYCHILPDLRSKR